MKEFLILICVSLVAILTDYLLIKFEIYYNKDLFYYLHKNEIDKILKKGEKIDD